MELQKRIVGDVAILAVIGEITLKKNGDVLLNDNMRSLVQEGHSKVLLDLAGVSYIDSAGLGELVQAHSTIRNLGGAMKVFRPTPRLRELLVLTRLTTVFGMYDDEASALAAFGAPKP